LNSADPAPTELRRVRRRVLDLYDAVTFLMLIGIGVLVLYSILLGSLASPGAQQSFGYALALMFLMGAMMVHLVDRTYRVWPLGRRFAPTRPGPVTARSQARFLAILILVIAAAGIAYVIGSLVS
jgi:hypothetical protein